MRAQSIAGEGTKEDFVETQPVVVGPAVGDPVKVEDRVALNMSR